MKILNRKSRELHGGGRGRQNARVGQPSRESKRAPHDTVTLSTNQSSGGSDGLAVVLGTAGTAVGFALGVAASLTTGLGAVALVGIPLLSTLGGWAGLKACDAIQGVERGPISEEQQQQRNRRVMEHAADLTDEMLFDPTSPIFMP